MITGQKKRLDQISYELGFQYSQHFTVYSKKMWGTLRMNTESFRFKNNENLSGRHDSAM